MITQESSPVAVTALYHEHLRDGAQMTQRDGWLVPRRFGDGTVERTALQQSVGLLDIGAATVLDIACGDLDAFLAAALPGCVPPPIGTSITREQAGRVRIARLTDEQARIVAPPTAGSDLVPRLIGAAAGRFVTVSDVTGGLCAVRLVGPGAPEVLQRVSALDLAPDRYADGAVAQGPVAGVPAVILRRDRGGLYGYDIDVTRDLGLYLWQALRAAGVPLGLTPVGFEVGEGWA